MTLVVLYFAWSCTNISRKLLYIALALAILSLLSKLWSIFDKLSKTSTTPSQPPSKPQNPNVNGLVADDSKKTASPAFFTAVFVVFIGVVLLIIVPQLITLYMLIKSFQCSSVPVPVSVLWVLSFVLLSGLILF